MSERMEKVLRIIIAITSTISVVFMWAVLVPIMFIYCSYNAIRDKDIEYLTALRDTSFDLGINWMKFIINFYYTGEIDYTYFE